ncbi:hypothetical protein Daesc_006111 [Daldinia eschscholtzii]|uniref:Uncharacterized protein n=1 Tax=Daldinia eschscholtzii TaxID=292717 RepID=A0AAX6MG36_9PEZI
MLATTAASIWQCTPVRRAWDKSVPGTCISITRNWYSNAGFSIATDIMILVLPMQPIFRSNLPPKQKWALVIVFALGIFVTITSILRTQTIDFSSTSTDPTYDIASSTWTVIEENLAIICACLPMCKGPLNWLFPSVFMASSRRTSTSYKPSHPTNNSNRNYWAPTRGDSEMLSTRVTSVQGRKATDGSNSQEHMLEETRSLDRNSDVEEVRVAYDSIHTNAVHSYDLSDQLIEPLRTSMSVAYAQKPKITTFDGELSSYAAQFRVYGLPDKLDPFNTEAGSKRKTVIHDGDGRELVPTGNSTVPTFPRLLDLALGAAEGQEMVNGVEYTLVGLGVRTVSFLGIQVYMVGYYIATQDIAALQSRLVKEINPIATTLVPSEKDELRKALLDPERGEKLWNDILQEVRPRSLFRVVPVRDTDFHHLRDGFVRAISARSQGNSRDFGDENFGEAMKEFRGLFNRGKVPKGREMLLVRDTAGRLTILFDDGKAGMGTIGRVSDERVSRLLWLNYLAGSKVASEPARKNIVEGIMEFVERPVGTVATQVGHLDTLRETPLELSVSLQHRRFSQNARWSPSPTFPIDRMLDTASTIAVILVPLVLIAIILAMWYCPFRHVSHSHPGAPDPSTATATVESIPLPSETPSYELEAHQSFRLSRISEEGGPMSHSVVHR